MASISGLRTTIVGSLRYRGDIGHWSWVAHRISGLAILGFLTIHVWDTANATFYPHVYAWSIDVFKHPFFGIGEVAVLGAVLYHAFNGVKITLLDFNPGWWEHQKTASYIAWGLFLIIFVPIAIYLLISIGTHCVEASTSCWVLPSLSDPKYQDIAAEFARLQGGR